MDTNKEILKELEVLTIQCVDIDEKSNAELAEILKQLDKIYKSEEILLNNKIKEYISEVMQAIESLILRDIDPIDDEDSLIETIFKNIDLLKRNIENNTLNSQPEVTPSAEETTTEDSEDNTEENNDEDAEIFIDFLQEVNEYIEVLENEIINLENDPTNMEIINNIFRPFHTLKGVSGFMGLTKLNRLSHETENLLDLARNNKLLINEQIIDGILASIDAIKLIKNGLSPENRNENISDDQLNNLINALQQLANSKNSQPTENNQIDVTSIKNSIKNDSSNNNISTKSERIKVKTEKLDSLNNMIGELVITTNLIREDHNVVNILDHDFQRKFAQLSLVVRELQKMSMSLRMVPIASTFQKMKRVVRDYTHKTKKKINIHFIGEETEIDRNFVELLSDPLVHMIRNSCDHGIEPNKERLQNGKPEIGNITLKAYHQGNNIIIDVIDDGRGLNKEAILKKAIERGIVQENQKLTNQEIYKCIFAPGFSTAEKITNVSGRGVGMDVVVQSIKNMNGSIKILTEEGKGTTFRISLPLTLAIIEGVIIKVADELFIIPVTNVKRTIQPSSFLKNSIFDEITTIKVEDNLLPILDLASLFNLTSKKDNINDKLLIILENQGKQIALAVDELIGIQDVVVKSLGEKFSNLKGISGGTILGDGSIGLIINITGLTTW